MQLPIVIQLKKQEYKSWLIIPIIRKPKLLIIATPAASPSSPSIQFIAFVIATIQNSVNGKPIIWFMGKEGIIWPNKEKLIDLKIKPWLTIKDAIENWNINLLIGERFSKSSVNPRRKKSEAPISITWILLSNNGFDK